MSLSDESTLGPDTTTTEDQVSSPLINRSSSDELCLDITASCPQGSHVFPFSSIRRLIQHSYLRRKTHPLHKRVPRPSQAWFWSPRRVLLGVSKRPSRGNAWP